MIDIIFIRHAETKWNIDGLIQGHTDIPLCELGVINAQEWRLPQDNYICWTSPLQRAKETANILFSSNPIIEQRLIEMNWGEWEGKKLSDLRKNLGVRMINQEKLGLDMRPDNGETPREVQSRIKKWLMTLNSFGTKHVCVTHKGVIRSAISLALNWDMTGEAPLKVKTGNAYIFSYSQKNLLKYDSTISLC